MQDIREALLEVSDTDNDATISSEAKSLATNELGDFEFIVAIIIWFEVLSAVNLVSKQLQAKDMLIFFEGKTVGEIPTVSKNL